jgi:hypothetical protein
MSRAGALLGTNAGHGLGLPGGPYRGASASLRKLGDSASLAQRDWLTVARRRARVVEEENDPTRASSESQHPMLQHARQVPVRLLLRGPIRPPRVWQRRKDLTATLPILERIVLPLPAVPFLPPLLQLRHAGAGLRFGPVLGTTLHGPSAVRGRRWHTARPCLQSITLCLPSGSVFSPFLCTALHERRRFARGCV